MPQNLRMFPQTKEAPKLPSAPQEPLLPKPKNKTKIILMIIGILLLAAAIGAVGFFAYDRYVAPRFFGNELEDENLESDSDVEMEEIDETENWQTYKTDDFEVKYPSKDYEKIVKNIEVKEDKAIEAEYNEKQKTDKCLGACQKFASDKDLLAKQFEILNKINSEDEDFDEKLEKEIKDKFLLLSDGIDIKYYIDTLYNENLDAFGLNMIGYDAYDAGDISKFYYRAVFLVGGKVISFKFPLYPENALNKKMVEYGYDASAAKCAEGCVKKMEDASKKLAKDLEELEFSDDLLEITDNYDLIVGSLKFTK